MSCLITLRSTLAFVIAALLIRGDACAEVKVEDYPSKVVIRAFGVSHACGGVLITPEHVLTVAHCVLKKTEFDEYLDASPIKAYKVTPVDATLTGNPTEILWKQKNELWVSKVDIHKNRTSSENISADIAVLTLFVPTEESATRKPASLPTSEAVIGQEVSALAYGFKYDVKTGVKGDETHLLKLATFNVTNSSSCNRSVNSDEFCATNFQEDTCWGYAGDSLRNKNNQVVGLITRPWNCSVASEAVLDIFPYKSWIEGIINNGSSPDTKHMRQAYTTFTD